MRWKYFFLCLCNDVAYKESSKFTPKYLCKIGPMSFGRKLFCRQTFWSTKKIVWISTIERALAVSVKNLAVKWIRQRIVSKMSVGQMVFDQKTWDQLFWPRIWHHAIQQNAIQHNETEHKGLFRHWAQMTLRITTPSVVCCYAECHLTESQCHVTHSLTILCVESCYAECRILFNVECGNAEWHYA